MQYINATTPALQTLSFATIPFPAYCYGESFLRRHPRKVFFCRTNWNTIMTFQKKKCHCKSFCRVGEKLPLR